MAVVEGRTIGDGHADAPGTVPVLPSSREGRGCRTAWNPVRAATPIPGGGPGIDEVVAILVSSGVRPALGHFHKFDPARNAESILRVIDVARQLGARPFDGSIITDHLFNDMPCLVRYAWRTPENRRVREEELAALELDDWDLDHLPEIVGPVPATLMQQAVQGWLTLCLNFDGEHVDHAVARRAVQLVGPSNVMVMSDRSDVPFLGGQPLTKGVDSGLWYQSERVVAAGSTSLSRQMAYIAEMGHSVEDLWTMSSFVALRVLDAPSASANLRAGWCSTVAQPRLHRSVIGLRLTRQGRGHGAA